MSTGHFWSCFYLAQGTESPVEGVISSSGYGYQAYRYCSSLTISISILTLVILLFFLKPVRFDKMEPHAFYEAVHCVFEVAIFDRVAMYASRPRHNNEGFFTSVLARLQL